MRVDEVAAAAERVLDEVEKAVVGKREALQLLLQGILADGHVLIEDNPGLAKTLMARSLATVSGLEFGRIQFTPDLMPGDVTGSVVYDQKAGSFDFRSGPIFTNLLLADEINRAPAKTQSALLEAMAERQVTVDGETHRLEPPFIVIATQNPIEFDGTYPLPEAQLDRFILRLSIGYPGIDDEWQMAASRMERQTDDFELRPIIDRPTLLEMQRALESVYVSEAVGRYIVRLVDATRSSTQLRVGASPRGTLALLKLARARAAMEGRDFVTPDDVKGIAPAALGHRLVLRPELWVQGLSGGDVIGGVIEQVPAPTAEEALRDR